MNLAAGTSGRPSLRLSTTSHGAGSRRTSAPQRSSRAATTCRGTRPAGEQQGPVEAGDLELPPQERGRGETRRLVPVVDETGLQRRQDSSCDAQLAEAAEAAAAAVHQRLLRRLRLADMTAVMSKAQPELVAIALVYLVQGLLGLSRLAVFTFLKDDLALAPATVALITSAGYAPWMIKPVYGFLSDAVPLFGYRRCSYLVLCGLLGAASWGGMATVASTPTAVVLLLLLGSASTACADVVADSVVVELVRRPGSKAGTAGSLQSLCWASASAGGIASAYFSGSLVGDYGARAVFGVTAMFPLLVTGAALAIPEERVRAPGVMAGSGRPPRGTARGVSPAPNEGVVAAFKQQATLLWATAKQRTILLPAVFVFLWQATPTADTAMLFFETNRLGFTPEVLGRIRLVGALASLVGVGLFNFKLKHMPLRKILFWTAIIGTGLGLTQLMLVTGVNRQLGLSDQLFALADTALLTVLGQVAFMPLLVLAARICPEGVEATLFATLMSLLNSGTFVGSALGSALTAWLGVTSDNFDNLAPLVVICTLSALLPLPLLRLLPEGVDQEREGEADGGSDSEGSEDSRKAD